MHPDLTAERGAEAGDPDLPVFAVLVEKFQGAPWVSLQISSCQSLTLIHSNSGKALYLHLNDTNSLSGQSISSYIAGWDSILAGDADVVLVDVEGELQGAGQVGDGVHSGVPQHRTDAVSLVSWLPCILHSYFSYFLRQH